MIVIIPPTATASNINRLTNQMWKLIPMRENQENWLEQLDTVYSELLGLGDIYLIADSKFVKLMSKLKGLKSEDITFFTYRKTVFECISLLREMRL